MVLRRVAVWLLLLLAASSAGAAHRHHFLRPSSLHPTHATHGPPKGSRTGTSRRLAAVRPAGEEAAAQEHEHASSCSEATAEVRELVAALGIPTDKLPAVLAGLLDVHVTIDVTLNCDAHHHDSDDGDSDSDPNPTPPDPHSHRGGAEDILRAVPLVRDVGNCVGGALNASAVPVEPVSAFTAVGKACIEAVAASQGLSPEQLVMRVKHQLEYELHLHIHILWPVWNWPFALWQWVKQMAVMYGTSIVPWLDWVSPTSVWDFIVPGVYTWAAIIKNAYFTNAFAIRQAGVGSLAQDLEDARREQQVKLGELLTPLVEALHEVFAAWKHYAHKPDHTHRLDSATAPPP